MKNTAWNITAAYWDENPDPYLVNRHEREIFPLLHRRYLFADVEDFYLYDFYNQEGFVEENVFAYSNRIGEPGTEYCQRSLVIYHNCWADVRGWINPSAAYKDKKRNDDALIQTNLGAGLGLQNQEGIYTIFQDHVTGLEYIRSNVEIHEKGMYAELGAYKYQVFINFREVVDNEWGQYAQLSGYLNGRGVPDIENALREIFLAPIHKPYKALVNSQSFTQLLKLRRLSLTENLDSLETTLTSVNTRAMDLFNEIENFTGTPVEGEILSEEITRKLTAILNLPILTELYPLPKSRNYQSAYRLIINSSDTQPALVDGDLLSWGILLGWAFSHTLGKVLGTEGDEARSRRLMDEWLLGKIILDTFQDLGVDLEIGWNGLTCIKALVSHQNWYLVETPKRNRASRILKSWLEDKDIQEFLRINKFKGITWFNKEALETLLHWMLTIGVVNILADSDKEQTEDSGSGITDEILTLYKLIKRIQKASADSEYQVDKLLALVVE